MRTGVVKKLIITSFLLVLICVATYLFIAMNSSAEGIQKIKVFVKYYPAKKSKNQAQTAPEFLTAEGAAVPFMGSVEISDGITEYTLGISPRYKVRVIINNVDASHCCVFKPNGAPKNLPCTYGPDCSTD